MTKKNKYKAGILCAGKAQMPAYILFATIGNSRSVVPIVIKEYYTVPATSFAASVAGSVTGSFVLPAASSAHLSNFSIVAL